MASKKKARALSPHVLLAYLFVITFVLTGVSFARFGNTKTADDAARAATFDVKVISAPSGDLLEVTMDESGNKTVGNYIFEVQSISEVPVTYTISTDTTGAAPLEYGIEMYLTPIYSDSDLEKALAGVWIANQTHVHRPDGTHDVHNFVGNGFAPAGTHTQKFVLNFHYTGPHPSTGEAQAGMSQTVDYKIWDNIKIRVVARDGRDGAQLRAPDGESVKPKYTTPYTPEE